MKLKTQKSVSKRFKQTRNNKMVHRTAGQDHFNSRETGKTIKNKRRSGTMSNSYYKVIKSSLS